MWFPKERVALVNGYMIMLGSLGAVTATAPTEWLLDWVGWRGLFEVLTLATFATAGLVYCIVPEPATCSDNSTLSRNPVSLKTVYSDQRFWRIAPLSAACIGSSWALHSLWAAPWLSDVEGLDRPSLINQLFFMALGISLGALVLGTMADRLRRRGITTEVLLTVVAVLFIAAQFILILRLPLPSLVPWSIVSVVGAATVLSYATIAEYFPMQLAARANGALNLLHFGWAFAVQYGIGLVVGQWSPQDGHYPLAAYQTALGLGLFLQVLALAWFAIPWLRALGSRVHTFFVRRYAEHHRLAWVVIPPAEIAVLEASEGAEW